MRQPLLPLASSVVAATLGLASAGCGTDLNLSVRLASGTVAETARCDGRGGDFPLRQDDGLTVVIVVTDHTRIVRADFAGGSCRDIVDGDRATVSGSDDGGRIRAARIELADA